MSDWRQDVSPFLLPPLREDVANLPQASHQTAKALRLRIGQSVILEGGAPYRLEVIPTAKEIQQMADAMLGHVRHARQTELSEGFVTLPGGHRVGFAGRCAQAGNCAVLQGITSLHIRIAHAVLGCALPLLPHAMQAGKPRSLLIISPPGLGKTTLLRDLSRLLSLSGCNIAVMDERSELAASFQGQATLDLGPNTDVMDGCRKAQGMQMLLRTMAPDVMVTDEIGTREDAGVVLDAARSGIAVVASAHGDSFQGICDRPTLRPLVTARAFERFVVLAGLGSIGAVYDAKGERIG